MKRNALWFTAATIPLFAAVLIAGCGGKTGKSDAEKAPEATQAATVTCPVCKMKLTRDQVAATYRYEGQTYHFCMPSEVEKFAADPEKYLTASVEGSAPSH
jgi:YHS domain-containing protein